MSQFKEDYQKTVNETKVAKVRTINYNLVRQIKNKLSYKQLI